MRQGRGTVCRQQGCTAKIREENNKKPCHQYPPTCNIEVDNLQMGGSSYFKVGGSAQINQRPRQPEVNWQGSFRIARRAAGEDTSQLPESWTKITEDCCGLSGDSASCTALRQSIPENVSRYSRELCTQALLTRGLLRCLRFSPLHALTLLQFYIYLSLSSIPSRLFPSPGISCAGRRTSSLQGYSPRVKE